MVTGFLNENWLPKSVLCLRTYNKHKLLLDIIAGITVGLVALPLAMAFSVASRLTPQAGIYCAIVTALDATGLFAIEEGAKELHAKKRTLILCGAREQPAQLIHQAEFAEVIGEENICENVQDAVRRAEEVYERLERKAVAAGK